MEIDFGILVQGEKGINVQVSSIRKTYLRHGLLYITGAGIIDGDGYFPLNLDFYATQNTKIEKEQVRRRKSEKDEKKKRKKGGGGGGIGFFFFNDTATTEIYTLSLHDALPISTASD